jgi:hypothetical protein
MSYHQQCYIKGNADEVCHLLGCDYMISTVREVCEVYEVLMIVTDPLGCAPLWYKSTQVTEGDAALLGFFQQ